MGNPDVSNIYDKLPDNSHKSRSDAKQKQEMEGKRAEKIGLGRKKVCD